ncbi:hypothetical protein EDM80_01440 [bacterium]|nr:MAG: hypothetical protein EDM80_01440 [bacterium]
MAQPEYAMNILQIASLLFIATGLALMAYAVGWLILQIVSGRGSDFGAEAVPVSASQEPRPVLRLLVGSGRQVFALLSGRRRAA